jgi:hypothetical protein
VKRLAAVGATCTALALASIWGPKYLPMTDLPLHAEQLFLLLNLENPLYPFASLYAVNWWTPYGLSMAAAALIAPAIGVLPALKVLITIGVVGFPVSLYFLARAAGADPWWALLGFPLAFGFAFTWGFLAYIVAVPFAVAVFTLSIRQEETPSFQRGALIVALATIVYFLHGMAFGFAVASGTGAVLAADRPWREWGKYLKLLLPFALVVLFIVIASMSGELLVPALKMAPLSRLARLVARLPAYLVSGAYRPWAWCTGVFILAVPFIGASPRRSWRRWLPLAFTAAVAVVAEFRHAGFGGTQRLSICLLPALMASLAPAAPPARRGTLSRALSALTAVLFLSFNAQRIYAFDQRARTIDPIFEAMQPNKRVLSLVFGKQDPAIPGYLWSHLPAWYQCFKGGYYQYSFTANMPHMIVTQRVPDRARLWEALEQFPEEFRWDRHGGFDYFVIKSKEDRTRDLFGEHRHEVKLLRQSGRWWLYERKGES